MIWTRFPNAMFCIINQEITVHHRATLGYTRGQVYTYPEINVLLFFSGIVNQHNCCICLGNR